MARARNRDAVLKVLRKALDEDRTKTFVVEISPLGLVEMTRQNVTDGVREIMTKPCPTCDGEGVVKSEETIAIEVERQLRELVAERGHGRRRGLPRADEPAGHRLLHRRRRARCCTRSRTRPAATSTSRAPRGCRSTTSRSSRRAPREEIEEQSVPFREGEEVHVDIVEPHMYSEDDAVAKVDGYLIEVIDAIPYVGEKMLVRIEEAGRTAARAVLAATVAEEAAAATEERREGARARGQARARPRGAQAGAQGAGAVAPTPEEVEAVEALADDETPCTPAPGPPPSPRPTRTPRSRAGRRRARPRRDEAERREPTAEPDGRDAPRPSPPTRGLRGRTTRYHRSLGAAAAEADGAVRVRRPMPTPRKSPKPASDLNPCPKPPTPSSAPAASSTASRRGRPCSSSA